MIKIYIVTKYNFIFSNIRDYLNQFLDISISMIEDFSCIKEYFFDSNDLIIIFTDSHDEIFYNNLSLIKANIIFLTNLKTKNLNISNVTIIRYPIYLQELLNAIKNMNIHKLASINEYTIPGYTLKVIYEEITLENKSLNKSINMTVTEGKILKNLFIHYPKPVSKKDISIFDNIKIETNSIETHIFNIKKKLSKNKFCIKIKKENDNYKLVLSN